MFNMIANITIGNYQFESVNSIEIERSSRSLIDTAKILLPLEAVFANNTKQSLSKVVKKGDSVIIQLGYGNDIETEFQGYINSISEQDNKTVIECEDEAYKLHSKISNKSFENTTLKTIIDFVAQECNLEVSNDIPDVNINGFLIWNNSGLDVLNNLMKDYVLVAFIDYDNKLFCGLRNVYRTGDVVFDLNLNTISQENQIKFKTEDDEKYLIRAISVQKDNSRFEVELGDTDGQLRTFHFTDVSDEEDLQRLAQEELNNLKFTGYEGTVTCFGQPFTQYGMNAEVRDSNYPEREGNYLIDSVKITYNNAGFRRINELGIKL